MFINGWPPLAAGFQKNGSQFYWWNPNVYHVSWSCCILIAICCNKNTSFLWGFITHRSSDCHFPGLEHLSLRGLFGARSCHLRRNHPRIFPKWWMNQWENEGLTNGFSPANDGWTHGKPKITIKSKGLRVKKAPLFDPFPCTPTGFSCISDTSCNGRAPPERVSVPVPAAPPTHCWRLGWSCSACPGLQPIWAAGRPRLGRYQLDIVCLKGNKENGDSWKLIES